MGDSPEPQPGRLLGWRAADRLLQRGPGEEALGDADLDAVITRLLQPDGWRYRLRSRLIDRLSRLPLSADRRRTAGEAFLRIAQEEPGADQRGRLARWALLATLASGLLVGAILWQETAGGWWSLLAATLVGAFPVAVIVAPVAERSEAARCAAVLAAALEALGRMPLPGAAPTVAKASRQRGVVGRVARRALPAVLATLRPEDYHPGEGRLTPDLCRLLSGADDDLQLDLLRALERVGDGRGADAVAAFAACALAERLAARAREVAALLAARRTRENQARTLLRPAEAPADPAAILLRPAAPGTPGADAALLVRPSARPEE